VIAAVFSPALRCRRGTRGLEFGRFLSVAAASIDLAAARNFHFALKNGKFWPIQVLTADRTGSSFPAFLLDLQC
jgi:hypothetical protein